MHAAVVHEWGAPLDVVKYEETAEPLVGPDTALVEVAAAGVNPVDWKILTGGMAAYVPTHLPLIPGWDMAGTVVMPGPTLPWLKPGDRVAAYAREDHIEFGTFAERKAVHERAIAKVPDNVGLDIAGALPLVGLTALQALDAVDVSAGDSVLIHNASGGVGTIALQLAVLRGATVAGTTSPSNNARLEARGATPVDYHHLVEDAKRVSPNGFDVIVDLIGGEAVDATQDLLKPGGRIVSIADPLTRLAGMGFVTRYWFVRPDGPGLAGLLDLVSRGDLAVDIAARYPLTQAAQALEENRTGHTSRKILIAVDSDLL